MAAVCRLLAGVGRTWGSVGTANAAVGRLWARPATPVRYTRLRVDASRRRRIFVLYFFIRAHALQHGSDVPQLTMDNEAE